MTFSTRIVRNRFALAQRFRSATIRVEERETAILVVDDGRTRGLGELAPLPGYSDETLETAIESLRGFELEALLGTILRQEYDEARVRTAPLPPSARCAVEVACLDLVARSRGIAVAQLLGAAPDAVRRPGRLVGVDDEGVRFDGARAIKLKVGVEPSSEIERVRALLASHPGLELRVDANRSLDPAHGGSFVHALVEAGVAFVEEPYAALEDTLAAAASGLPVALDESLRSLDEEAVARLLAAPTAIHLVLKPTTLGFLRAERLARIALARGRRAILSHTFEGAVGYSACAALAVALPEASPGLDADYGPRLGARVPPCLVEGQLVVPRSPGLGLEPEEIG